MCRGSFTFVFLAILFLSVTFSRQTETTSSVFRKDILSRNLWWLMMMTKIKCTAHYVTLLTATSTTKTALYCTVHCFPSCQRGRQDWRSEHPSARSAPRRYNSSYVYHTLGNPPWFWIFLDRVFCKKTYKLRLILPCKSDCHPIFLKKQGIYSLYAKLWLVKAPD